MISSAWLIAAFDTRIDHSLNGTRGGISLPLWGRPSHRLCFPPPLFVDVDVTCREGCFQKHIFLITYLLGEEERGARLCLAGLLRKKTPLPVTPLLLSQGAFDKEKWALRLVPTSGPSTAAGLQSTAVERLGQGSQLQRGLDSTGVSGTTPVNPREACVTAFRFSRFS